MSKVLLDTDIFSEILKNNNPTVAARAAQYRQEQSRYRKRLDCTLCSDIRRAKGAQLVFVDKRILGRSVGRNMDSPPWSAADLMHKIRSAFGTLNR